MRSDFLNAKVAFILSLGALSASAAYGQTVPGPADSSRIKPEMNPAIVAPIKNAPTTLYTKPKAPVLPVPSQAKDIHFVLHAVHIDGATVFTPAQLAPFYKDFIGKDITLDTAYAIAANITEHYRDAGYFLSLAYVPNQRLKGGALTIAVTEGYVREVDLSPALRNSSIVKSYVDALVAQRPLTNQALESFLLRLNSLPGFAVSGVLSPIEEAVEGGAVKLTLKSAATAGKGQVGFDNASSRFLGPNEVSASYTTSLLPFQQTTISGLTSLPTDKLKYLTVAHSAVVAPDVTVEVTGAVTKAKPGYTLKPF